MKKQAPNDPFKFKTLSKANPIRLHHKVFSEMMEHWSRITFARSALPISVPPSLPDAPLSFDQEDTAVTEAHMQLLLHCLSETEDLEKPVVEIGTYRGVTSQMLASRTSRSYYLIDPYSGYGGADSDLTLQRSRTSTIPNAHFHRTTSGQFLRDHPEFFISFAFVDAVHDFINVWFDGVSWSTRLVPGGLIAFHDTDSPEFSGCRSAVTKLVRTADETFALYAHIENLTVLKRLV